MILNSESSGVCLQHREETFETLAASYVGAYRLWIALSPVALTFMSTVLDHEPEPIAICVALHQIYFPRDPSQTEL